VDGACTTCASESAKEVSTGVIVGASIGSFVMFVAIAGWVYYMWLAKAKYNAVTRGDQGQFIVANPISSSQLEL
jgi:hypothetical protein